MKKRLFSILLALCMVLCLVPTTAFAESETEEPPVCSCETACTTDNMNKECPVCGAENAIPQNCGQYIPVEDRTGENGSTERADDPNGPTELSAADQVQAMINALPSAEALTEEKSLKRTPKKSRRSLRPSTRRRRSSPTRKSMSWI